MGQLVPKHSSWFTRSKAERVEVAVPGKDRAYLQALARALAANDDASDRLRGEIEAILADEAGGGVDALLALIPAPTRH